MEAGAYRQHRQDPAAPGKRTASRHHRPTEDLKEGGLSRSVRPDKPQALTLVDIERDVIQCLNRALMDRLAAQSPSERAAEPEPLPELIRLPETRSSHRHL